MIIKHNDVSIESQNPFANCKLGREKYASILTSLVGSDADGFVLAINNEWGTGKTTFMKMWQQQLINQGFQTLYFNAWENDFENNALTALMAELSVLKKTETEELFKKILEKGSVLAKGILPILLKAIVSKHFNEEIIKDYLGAVSDGANDLLQKQIQEYTSKKEGLKDFREALVSFIQETKNDKPIVFIIDELDRCRPDYAVEVLEKIKHFFCVTGICFVLAIDKEQLCHAVRGVYGSENLNAHEYLRRFIDLEYAIPEPSTEQFCNYLFQYFGCRRFFSSNLRLQYDVFQYEADHFIKLAVLLFKSKELTLRQQEKIFAHANVALNSFQYNYSLVSH